MSGDMHRMREALKCMKPGQSFEWPKWTNHPYRAAQQIGVKISTRKTDKGMRIWRVK